MITALSLYVAFRIVMNVIIIAWAMTNRSIEKGPALCPHGQNWDYCGICCH
jgi:hypothetical protein